MKNRYIFAIIFAAAMMVFWRVSAQVPPNNMGCKGGAPNGVCDLGEFAEICMSDCPNNFGCVGGSSNGKCEAGEDNKNCVADCGSSGGAGTCGNNKCDNPGDFINGCPLECSGGGAGGGGGGIGGGCTGGWGDGICGPGETIEGCSNDCECDSDKVCEAPKENKTVCPTDCGCNHNGVCEKSNNKGFDETAGNCDDCGWECSRKRLYYSKSCNNNGKCEKDLGENFETCKKDCGLDYKSFSSSRYPDCNTIKTKFPSDIVCDYNGECGSNEKNCYDCVSWVDPYNTSIVHTDGRCNNNGICESQFESGYTCCDCGEAYCNHNGICENQTGNPLGDGSMETSLNCPDDCPNYCNSNGRCESFWELASGGVTTTPPKPVGLGAPKQPIFVEDSENCRFDCPCNKNGICEPNFGEDANNCSDCFNAIDCKNLSFIGSATRCDDKLSDYSKNGGGPYNCFADPPAQCEKGEVGKAWLNTGCNYDGICQPSACEGVGNCPDCSYLCGDGVCQQSAGSKQLINEKGDLLSFSLINWKTDRSGELGVREAGETPGNCYKDCYFGDLTYWPANSAKICNWQGDGGIKESENTDNSPIDCLCNADGKCDPWEGPKECRSDCVCNNDGVCEKGGVPLSKIECDDNDPDSANHCGECYKGIYIHYPKNPAKLSLNSSGKLSNSSMRSMAYGGSSWAMDVFVKPCWRPLTGTVIVSSKIGSVSGYSDCFDDAKSEEFFREMKKYCDAGVLGVNLWDYKRDCKQLPLPWYFPESAGIVSKNDFSYDVAKCDLAPTTTYYCKGAEWFKYRQYDCPARKDAFMSGPYWPSSDYSEELCPGFDFALKSFKDTEHNVLSLGSMSYIIGSPDDIKHGTYQNIITHDTDIDFADYVNSAMKGQCDVGKANPCDNDTICEPEKGENFYNCYYDCACPRIRNYQFGLVYQRQGCLSVSEKTWDEQKSGCRKDCGSCGDGYCQKEAQEKYSITLIPTGDTPPLFDPENPPSLPPSPPLPPCAGGLVEYTGKRGSDNANFGCSRITPNIANMPMTILCQNCANYSEVYQCDNFGSTTGTCFYSVTDEAGVTTNTELNYITSAGNRELIYKEEAWCPPGEATCAWQAGESGENCSQDCMPDLGVKTLEATSVTPYSADLRMNITGWGKDGTPGEYWFEYWQADMDPSTAGEQAGEHKYTQKIAPFSRIGTTTINVTSLAAGNKYYFIPYIRSKFGSDEASRGLMQGEQFSFQTLKGKCGTIIIDSPKNNSYVYPDEVVNIVWHYEKLVVEDSGCDHHYKMQILDGETLDSVLDVSTPKDLAKGTFVWGSPKTSDRLYKIRIIGYSATEDDMTNPADLNLSVPKLPVTKDWWASGSGLCNPGLPFINFGFNFENLLPDSGRGLVATFKLYNQSDISLATKLAEEDIGGKQVGIFSLSNYCADNDRKYYLTAALKWHGEPITVPPDSNGLDTKEVVLDDHKAPTIGFSYTIEPDGKLDLHAFPYPPPDTNENITKLEWYFSKDNYNNGLADWVVDVSSHPYPDPDGNWSVISKSIDLLKTGIWLEAFDNIGDDPYSCATSVLPDSGFRNVRFRENPEL